MLKVAEMREVRDESFIIMMSATRQDKILLSCTSTLLLFQKS